ncbi:MAG: helix-turn-helix transcriptional regulator [Actinobacteria bacterium]|nr:helix-turn-helix transcriptional regulator [Actinomycetota bacterium]MBL7124387.1 helix-turn-helix transcriptional regulator [Actinomycetota bacterium]
MGINIKTNWLWDSRLGEIEVRKILKDVNNPKFDIYAEKLFSRVSDPKIAFSIIDKVTFCKKWPTIKKRMRKDRWLKDRVIFWQTIFERIYEELKGRGVKLRELQEVKISPERMKLAQQIKDIRMKLGYTQEDIAKKLGTVQQYISKVENGHENFSIDTLSRIADVFDKGLVIKLK